MGIGVRKTSQFSPLGLGTVLAAVLVLLLLAGPAGSAEIVPANMPEQQGPRQENAPAAKQFDKINPGRAPAGANDFTCQPARSDYYPVLLAHGTDSSAYSDYARLAPFLRDHGYCVFALNYGEGKPGLNLSPATGTDKPTYGTTDMRRSAQEVASAVARIQSATGAPKVHLIGFSQGANVTRYYINKLGGAAHVDAWVGIASPTYGSDSPPELAMLPDREVIASAIFAPALVQQLAGSEFLTDLNGPQDTVPGVRYTTIGTQYDEVITPVGNMALLGPGARNILVQDDCPVDMSGHFQLPYSPLVSELVLEALDANYTAPTVCTAVPPGVGLIETFIVNNF